jgi:hypothetical protein
MRSASLLMVSQTVNYGWGTLTKNHGKGLACCLSALISGIRVGPVSNLPMFDMHEIGRIGWISWRHKRCKTKILRIHGCAELAGVFDSAGNVLADLSGSLGIYIEATLAWKHMVDMIFDLLTFSDRVGGSRHDKRLVLFLIFLLCTVILITSRFTSGRLSTGGGGGGGGRAGWLHHCTSIEIDRESPIAKRLAKGSSVYHIETIVSTMSVADVRKTIQ